MLIQTATLIASELGNNTHRNSALGGKRVSTGNETSFAGIWSQYVRSTYTFECNVRSLGQPCRVSSSVQHETCCASALLNMYRERMWAESTNRASAHIHTPTTRAAQVTITHSHTYARTRCAPHTQRCPSDCTALIISHTRVVCAQSSGRL